MSEKNKGSKLEMVDPVPGVGLVRREYLDLLQGMVIGMIRRYSMEHCDLCIENEKERSAEVLEKYAVLRARIASQAGNDMRRIEERGQDMLGVVALLGKEPEPAIRLVIALLIGKALSDSVASRFDNPVELAELAVGNHTPVDLLTIREAFAQGGILRPHCHLFLYRTVDQSRRVSLTERAIRTILGLDRMPAIEFEILEERSKWRNE